MSRASSCLLGCIVALAAHSAAAQTCSFVGFPQEWREATARDYDSDDWRAFQRFTGVKTPWRVQGDFNGDGLPDVARVVIKDADQMWMLGVEFGAPKGTPCATFQIMRGMPHQLAATLPSLQTLAQGSQKPLPCHHAGQRYAVACSVPQGSPLAGLKADALIVSDATAVRAPAAYYWTQWEQRTKSDGSPVMVFRETPLAVDVAWQ